MSTQIKKNGNWVTVAGGTRMWVGTKAALQAALDAGELVDGTAVMVTDDYEEEGTVVKSFNMVAYSLMSGSSSNTPAFSNTGWFKTNLKVDAKKVAVVFRHQHCLDINDANVYPMLPYNVSNDTDGNLIIQLYNASAVTKDCTRCLVWFHLIGDAKDLANV